MRWTIEMLMGAIGVYISDKFGGLLSSASAVNVAQLCTAGIDQHLGKFIYIYYRAAHLCFATNR